MTAPACTCGTRAPLVNSASPQAAFHIEPTRDIDCPVHGLDALIFEVRYPDEEEGGITGS